MLKPMLPSPMMPRVWPRGLCDSTAVLVWQSWNAADEPRAALWHHWRLRNVATMKNMAKSATDSVDAAALGYVR